jgi:hypothetical protein
VQVVDGGENGSNPIIQNPGTGVIIDTGTGHEVDPETGQDVYQPVQEPTLLEKVKQLVSDTLKALISGKPYEVKQTIIKDLSGILGFPREVIIDKHISSNMAQRGWTEDQIRETAMGFPAGTSRDQRSAGKTSDGVKRDDPATVYLSQDGGYIVVNERTHEVAAISDKKDPGFIPDSRIVWY